MRLDDELRAVRDRGRKALVPYLVGGLDGWQECVAAAVHAGADLVEVGVPFSDPIMDGPVIQAAGDAALAQGATIDSILDELARLDVGVPVVVMTYYNLFHHYGLERVAARLAGAGVAGTIVPDLSLEEVAPWRTAANAAGLANVAMVAPSTPPARASQLAHSSQGFLYAAARMAVTGETSDAGDAARVVALARAGADLPIYVGIGIGTPAAAAEAVAVADGAIVGTALVRRVLDGEGPRGVEAFIASLRHAID